MRPVPNAVLAFVMIVCAWHVDHMQVAAEQLPESSCVS